MQTTIGRKLSEAPRTGQQQQHSSDALNFHDAVSHGKITLYVRTHKRYVRINEIMVPTTEGLAFGARPIFASKRLFVYEDVIDEEQQEILENYRSLAKGLGIVLEVRHSARYGALRKFLALILRRRLASKAPSVSIDGEAISLLASSAVLGKSVVPEDPEPLDVQATTNST